VSQVDFYILPKSGTQNRLHFACRLTEKAYKLKHRVHICVDSDDTARSLDELLWTFRDGSFVPHEASTTVNDSSLAPVTIAVNSPPTADCHLLINLTDGIPEFVTAFPRIAEVVTSDESSKQLSRKRFADYRDQGHKLDTHTL